MPSEAQKRIAELEAKNAELKADRRGYSRALTNLQTRTGRLLDYLATDVEPDLKTKGLSKFRLHVDHVRKLLP